MRAVPMDATLSAYQSEHRLVPFSPIFIHDIASAGLQWVIFDAAALGPFKKQAHGHRRDNKKSLLYFGRDFSGWYSFGKIIKIVATRCHILKLKCTKFDFRWGSVADAAGGAYGASPDPLSGFKGPTNGREGGGRKEERRGMKRLKGMGRKGGNGGRKWVKGEGVDIASLDLSLSLRDATAASGPIWS